MKIFYTGSETFLGESTAKLSLGGYISGTEVENASLSNVFDLVSEYTKKLNKPAYSVLALYNDDTAQTAQNIVAYFDYPDESSDSVDEDVIEAIFSIGGAAATVNDCGDILYSPKLKANAAPFGVSFIEADIDTPLSIPDMVPESFYILILKRTLNTVTRTDEELEAIARGELIIDTVEQVDLKIDYDLA